MRVRFTRRAIRQLDTILAHLAKHGPQGAASIAHRVSEIVRLLSEHPSIGRLTTRARIRRVALVPYPYVIDYRVDIGEVVILGIRHTSRRPLP